MGHFVKMDDSCYFTPVARQGLPHAIALMVYISVGPQPSNVINGVTAETSIDTSFANNLLVSVLVRARLPLNTISGYGDANLLGKVRNRLNK